MEIMLSTDLAGLYEVEARALVQAVKRNIERFPPDFMFQLSDQEFENLKSQIGDGSRFSVERMTVAGHGRPQADEGCRHAFKRCPQQARRHGQRRDHAGLCAPPPNACRPRRTGPKACRFGKEIRCSIQGHIRCHTGANDSAARKETPDWVYCTFHPRTTVTRPRLKRADAGTYSFSAPRPGVRRIRYP
jgi:ORF6N domain-containing protein